MDFQNILFSQIKSQKRMEKAMRVVPYQVLKKILFFALYVLGATLKEISSIIEIPEGSGKTTVNRVMQDGICALEDRRQSVKRSVPVLSPPQDYKASVLIQDGYCIISLGGDMDHQLKINKNHRVHLRSVLLSLFKANLLSIDIVSSTLEISVAYCKELATKLEEDGATNTLVEKRKGPKEPFCVDSSIKTELIENFAARAVTGHSISSQALADVINDSQNTKISSRTISWHMNKLGLMKIKKSLPQLVETLKKKF